MFEMKNEADETATKHKNEDFFRELDKDRREKKCEYAVLVSLLEADSELYNNGIVDVSYRYEKMYVIRPQFFIPIITLLRNAALGSLKYRQELEIARHQQIDVLHFEENMNAFKEGFGRQLPAGERKVQDRPSRRSTRPSTHLQKTKEALLSSENNLRLANSKAEDLSIKRLTKNAPSVRELCSTRQEAKTPPGERRGKAGATSCGRRPGVFLLFIGAGNVSAPRADRSQTALARPRFPRRMARTRQESPAWPLP